MGERVRKVLAVAHAVAAGMLMSALVLQGPYMPHVAILVVLHAATCLGLLRPQPWVPWVMGVLSGAGLVFAALSLYTPIQLLGLAIETYLLLTGLSAYTGLLIASFSYAIFRRGEFSA